MSPELDEKLVAEFPGLYRDRHASIMESAMPWGFQCGDGWFNLIWTLSRKLAFLANAEASDVRVTTVKEKYGTLSFYVMGATDIMHDCINAAEHRSAQICEVCGDNKTASVRRLRAAPYGWLACRCAKCAHGEDYPLSEWEAGEIGVTEYIKDSRLD